MRVCETDENFGMRWGTYRWQQRSLGNRQMWIWEWREKGEDSYSSLTLSCKTREQEMQKRTIGVRSAIHFL
jgi:hypothetical protein